MLTNRGRSEDERPVSVHYARGWMDLIRFGGHRIRLPEDVHQTGSSPEPIVIRRQDREIAVVLSMADYERLRTGNIQAFLELRNQIAAEAAANRLTEEPLNELLADEDA